MNNTLYAKFMSFVIVISILIIGQGCNQQEQKTLIVYAGKGLKKAMEDVKLSFEKDKGIPVSIVYAGSSTLLTAIKNSRRGDIFIPGSQSYINKAGELVVKSQYIAHHVPGFAVKSSNQKNLNNYSDLLKLGIRIAVTNKDMAALGQASEAILSKASARQSYRENIVITSSTVNEVMQLLVDDAVDASLIWTDMLQWQQAKGLKLIPIPDGINQVKELRVAVLSTSNSIEQANIFADFVAKKGQEIFSMHGFEIK